MIPLKSLNVVEEYGVQAECGAEQGAEGEPCQGGRGKLAQQQYQQFHRRASIFPQLRVNLWLVFGNAANVIPFYYPGISVYQR